MTVPVASAVTFAAGGADMGASAQTDGRTVWMQGKPDRQTLAHEMAHVLDTTALTDSDRARFARIMGTKGPWEPTQVNGGQVQTTHGAPSERFADMVSMLATKRFPKPGQGGGFGFLDEDPPSLRELLRLGRSLERMRKRQGLGVYNGREVRRQALEQLSRGSG